MKTITAMALALTTTTTFANVSGDWTGWAYWTFQGQGPKCDAKISFIDTASEIHRVKGQIDCSVVFTEMPEETLSKKDGKLFLDGEVVGTYTEDSYHWTEKYSENIAINIDVSGFGTHMDYHESWMDLSVNKELYDISARFFKSKNN